MWSGGGVVSLGSTTNTTIGSYEGRPWYLHQPLTGQASAEGGPGSDNVFAGDAAQLVMFKRHLSDADLATAMGLVEANWA